MQSWVSLITASPVGCLGIHYFCTDSWDDWLETWYIADYLALNVDQWCLRSESFKLRIPQLPNSVWSKEEQPNMTDFIPWGLRNRYLEWSHRKQTILDRWGNYNVQYMCGFHPKSTQNSGEGETWLCVAGTAVNLNGDAVIAWPWVQKIYRYCLRGMASRARSEETESYTCSFLPSNKMIKLKSSALSLTQFSFSYGGLA